MRALLSMVAVLAATQAAAIRAILRDGNGRVREHANFPAREAETHERACDRGVRAAGAPLQRRRWFRGGDSLPW